MNKKVPKHKKNQKKRAIWRLLDCYFAKKCTDGFSIIEVLVVLSIIGVVSTLGAVGFQSSQMKARDSQRKSDLQTIRTALENYYNDEGCYPQDASFAQACGQPFQTYLSSMPCDPVSKEPYLYVPLDNACQGYRMFGQLDQTSDPAIEDLGCDGETGCGYGQSYNYGIAAGVPVFDPNGPGEVAQSTPTPTPIPGGGTPTPAPSSPTVIYVYACDSGGVCNQYEEGHPYLINCPVTFEQPNCNAECGNVALRCDG